MREMIRRIIVVDHFSLFGEGGGRGRRVGGGGEGWTLWEYLD